jgi:predicted SAM-dependent methyltransferase
VKRINLGGNESFEGDSNWVALGDEWEHVDIRPLPNVKHVMDVRNLPAEWTDQYDEVRASHIIEHIHPSEALTTVKGWARILKPGGLLRIYCPNSRMLAEELVKGTIPIEQFSRLIFGDQEYDFNLHRVAYDSVRLANLVMSAGLTILSCNPRRGTSGYIYDIGVQATK